MNMSGARKNVNTVIGKWEHAVGGTREGAGAFAHLE